MAEQRNKRSEIDHPDLRRIAERLTDPAPQPVSDIYKSLTHLPPFGPVATLLLQMCDREDAEVRQLTRLIESEPALASELLVLSNSALFSFGSEISSIHHAVTVLGLDRVKSIATTVSLRFMTAAAPKTAILRRCWRHSIGCALIARELAAVCGVHPEQAYTAAILHDVGRLGLLAKHSEEYSRICITMHLTQSDVLAAEAERFQMDHCRAGLFLMRHWRLPQSLQIVVGRHHEAIDGEGLLPLVQASCVLADTLMLDAIRYRDIPKPLEAVESLPERMREAIAAKVDGIGTMVLEAIKGLDA